MIDPDRPLGPGNRIGILGGGQLGRMLAIAAARLGFDACIFADDPNAPAFALAGDHICAEFSDANAIEAFAERTDVVTFEFENVPAETVDIVSRKRPTVPGAKILETTNDRLLEKRFLTGLDIPTADFWACDTQQHVAEAVERMGTPAILKTRRFGYDGKGQVTIDRLDQVAGAWQAIGGAAAILEQRVGFDLELSVVLARSHAGDIRAFDVTENHHENHVLANSRVPARITAETARAAQEIAAKIAAALDYVGVMAVELFLEKASKTTPLRVNEIAPRVHNSGHWTLDGAVTCQFEQHIRAITGLPLGDSGRHSDAVMTNLIGDQVETWREHLKDPRTKLHIYGKSETKPGRKMGHVTRLTPVSRVSEK